VARQPEPVRPAADAGREIHLRPLTVGFIGSGRAASAVARGLHRAGHALLVGRRGDTAVGLADAVDAKLLDPGELLATADVTFLAVPDAAIAGLARDLAEMSPPGDGRLVAHFAGSASRSSQTPPRRSWWAAWSRTLGGPSLPSPLPRGRRTMPRR